MYLPPEVSPGTPIRAEHWNALIRSLAGIHNLSVAAPLSLQKGVAWTLGFTAEDYSNMLYGKVTGDLLPAGRKGGIAVWTFGWGKHTERPDVVGVNQENYPLFHDARVLLIETREEKFHTIVWDDSNGTLLGINTSEEGEVAKGQWGRFRLLKDLAGVQEEIDSHVPEEDRMVDGLAKWGTVGDGATVRLLPLGKGDDGKYKYEVLQTACNDDEDE